MCTIHSAPMPRHYPAQVSIQNLNGRVLAHARMHPMFVISRSYRYDLNVKNIAPLLDCLRARTHFLVKLLCSIVILLAGLIRSLHEVIQTILLRCMYSAGTTTLHLNTCSVQPACTQAITRPEPGSCRWRSARHCDLPGACLPQCVGFKGKGRIKYMGFILKGMVGIL